MLGREICTILTPLLSPVVAAVSEGMPLLHTELPKGRDRALLIVGCLAWLTVGTQ